LSEAAWKANAHWYFARYNTASANYPPLFACAGGASQAELEQLADRILDAASLDDLFQ